MRLGLSLSDNQYQFSNKISTSSQIKSVPALKLSHGNMKNTVPDARSQQMNQNEVNKNKINKVHEVESSILAKSLWALIIGF
jgi:hypothetical protein